MSAFLESILNPPETTWSEHVRVPVYRQADYIAALERDYREKGLEFDRSKFEFEGVDVDVTVKSPPPRSFPDPRHVPVTLTVMKNNKVKVTAHTAWTTLWERYFDKARAPPLRALVQGYKAIGCDDEFLKDIIRNHDKNVKQSKTFAKHIQKVFNKAKKVPKKKVKVEEPAEETTEVTSDAEEERDEDEDEADDDEGFDMEVEEEEAVEDEDVVLSDDDL